MPWGFPGAGVDQGSDAHKRRLITEKRISQDSYNFRKLDGCQMRERERERVVTVLTLVARIDRKSSDCPDFWS